ncbi:MAG: TonB-dependent receptor plug domain-containing protein [Gemmatimonadales bacterium]
MSRWILLLGVLPLTPVLAQERDTARADTARRLGDVVVETRRGLATVGGSAALELRLESLRLPPAPTLEQVFRTLPLLHVRRNSRGEAEFSARGSESRQVAVLVDGVPLTIAWDGRVDASVIPAHAVQRIGFVRGLSSMLHGPNVLGGVIELGVGQSFEQPTRSSAQFSAGFDHVGTYGGTGSVSMPFRSSGGQWLARAGIGWSDSPGFPLARGIVEPLPGEDEDLRVNTDAEQIDGFGSVRYQSSRGGWVSLSGTTFHAERGIAAELGVTNARFWRYPKVNRTIAIISGGTGDRDTPFGGRGDLEASLGLDVGRTEIDQYTGRDYIRTSGFEDGRDRTLTLRLLGDHTLGSRGELRASFTGSETRHDERLPDAEARYRQRLWSFGGETVWRLVERAGSISSLRLSLGGAYDIGETPESGGREPLGTISSWGARAGLSMVLGDGNTLVHGGVSRRARFPSLRELYSEALDRFAPNPDLKPEKLLAMEGGVTTRVGETELQAVAFRHQMRDAVVRITLPDRRFLRVNRNRLTSYGVELLASTLIGPATLGIDLTAQSVDLTDTEAGVTNRPENLPEVFGSVHVRTPVALGIDLGAEARYTGNQFCIDPGTGLDTRLSGGTIVNGEVSRVFGLGRSGGGGGGGGLFSQLEGSVSVFNAGNLALYDQCGLPEPGRLVRFQVKLF